MDMHMLWRWMLLEVLRWEERRKDEQALRLLRS